MPKVTINRPNRSRRRYFKACDAARIAREVVRDDPDSTPEEVLACIAKGFGFTHISLSRQRAVESAISLDKRAIKPLVVNLIKLIQFLSKKSRLLKEFLAPLLVVAKKIMDIVGKIDTLDPPQAEVDDVINKLKCQCKEFVVAQGGQVVE
jgi:hypothetical protein